MSLLDITVIIMGSWGSPLLPFHLYISLSLLLHEEWARVEWLWPLPNVVCTSGSVASATSLYWTFYSAHAGATAPCMSITLSETERAQMKVIVK
jgi:hypothetical protein